jgi:hypothetical protein
MEDSDYDYDEYFAKNLTDDYETEKPKGKSSTSSDLDNKKKNLKFSNELDLIIASRDDDDISSKFSKSLKVSSSKGKSLTVRKTSSTSTNNIKKIKEMEDINDCDGSYGGSYGGSYHGSSRGSSRGSNVNDYSKKESNEEKREINKKATLAAVLERQKRLEKIKEKTKKKEISLQMMNGIELLFNIMKIQNIKILEDVKHEFKSNLPFNIDMEAEFIKPPYLTPKIVSHKLERLLNQT